MVNRTPARNSVDGRPDSRPSIASGADRPPHPGRSRPVKTGSAASMTCKPPMLPAPEGPGHRTRTVHALLKRIMVGEDWHHHQTLKMYGNGPTPSCRSGGRGAWIVGLFRNQRARVPPLAVVQCVRSGHRDIEGVSAAALDRSPLADARGPNVSQFVLCRPGDPAGFDRPTSPAGPSCFAE